MNNNREILMERKSIVLLSIVFAIILISAFATYYKYIVMQDFEVISSEQEES